MVKSGDVSVTLLLLKAGARRNTTLRGQSSDVRSALVHRSGESHQLNVEMFARSILKVPHTVEAGEESMLLLTAVLDG